jgi:uncharacterized membrane protein YgcG
LQKQKGNLEMAEAYSGEDGTVDGVPGFIIKWEARMTAYKKEFGHNKSKGWQDLVYGIKRCEGTIEVKHTKKGKVLDAGKFHKLKLKTGHGLTLHGKAGIDEASATTVIENGEPVSIVYKFSSKGKWTKKTGGGGGSGSGGSGSGGSGSGGSGSGGSGSGGSGSGGSE